MLSPLFPHRPKVANLVLRLSATSSNEDIRRLKQIYTKVRNNEKTIQREREIAECRKWKNDALNTLDALNKMDALNTLKIGFKGSHPGNQQLFDKQCMYV